MFLNETREAGLEIPHYTTIEALPSEGANKKVNSAILVRNGLIYVNSAKERNYVSIILKPIHMGELTLVGCLYSNGATHSEEERDKAESAAEEDILKFKEKNPLGIVILGGDFNRPPE